MGFKTWAMSRLGSGADDPDRMVIVQYVAMWQGPMVLGALKDQGIVAHVIEDHSSKITGEAFVPRSRVMVRSSDLVEAAEVINDVLSGDASFDLATDLEFDDNSAEVPGLRTPLE